MARARKVEQLEWEIAQGQEPAFAEPVDFYQAIGVPRPNVQFYRSPYLA